MPPFAHFTCSLEDNFPDERDMVRAFTYRDYAIPTHVHDFYEINIVLAGEGVHQIESNSFAAGSGNVFVIPPGIVHGYSRTRRLDVFHLLIRPEFLENYAKDKAEVEGFELLMAIEPFLRHNFQKSLFLKLSPGQLQALQPDLEVITEGGPFDYPGSGPLKNHTALKILYWLSHLLTVQTYSGAKDYSLETEQSILLALEYIHENFSRRITIPELCERAYMSRSTFMRNFKAVCGCTPMQYLQAHRKKAALEMLKKGGVKKTAVAHECGFYDLSHMERVLNRDREAGALL